MSATRHPSSVFRITGWHVLAGFVAFFAAVIAVDAAMVTMAYRTHPGAVSVTPYEDGLAYNRDIAQKRAQEALGWAATIDLNRVGRIEATVTDAAGAPVRGLATTALMSRPATEEGRFSLAFREVRPGVYAAVDPHPGGAWDVNLEARDAAGHRFLAERRIVRP